MKKNVDKLLIFVPLIGGIIVSLLVNMENFKVIEKPPFSPPAIVFPIVWTILYILMGISYYIVDKNFKNKWYFWTQLIFNYIWNFLFFTFKLYLLSAIWILIIIYLTINMIVNFYKNKKIAGYLNIGYFAWLIIALYLNIGVYLLNR